MFCITGHKAKVLIDSVERAAGAYEWNRLQLIAHLKAKKKLIDLSPLVSLTQSTSQYTFNDLQESRG